MLAAVVEFEFTALVLAVFGALMAFSVLFSRALDRAGVPVVLLFLVLGMLGGSEGLGGLEMDDHTLAFRLGTIALVLILFDGGMNTRWSSVRRSAGPAGLLATVGVLGTAGVLALIGRALGLDWGTALLIGAIVSSTDAAAVFAVLRGGSLRLRERVRSTIEVESCVNDPMAVILTVTIVESLIAARAPSPWILLLVPMQLAIGAAVGAGVGVLARSVLTRVAFSTAGLMPVVTLACACIAFGAATLAQGSGFLAVFAAGLVLGNTRIPYRGGLSRVHDALAWLGQVGMFLMLGLLVFPSQLVPVAGTGLVLGVALALVARPAVVLLCLAVFRVPMRETALIGWVGLRGAVPIILATVPVMAGLPEGQRIFHIVFFIVVVSTLLPGAGILPVARRLGLAEPERPGPAAAVEMHSLRLLDGDIRVYSVGPEVAVCGAMLSEIALPEGASVALIVRGRDLIAARGSTRLEAGDHVYIFCKPPDEPMIGLLFGAPTNV